MTKIGYIIKGIKYLLVGLIFGIVMTKSEVLSWYRIQEMFRFQSFHMYGIIGSAVILGIIALSIIKKLEMRNLKGQPIKFIPKQKTYNRYILGGTIFGLGWALTGACPGPMFVLVGNAYWVMFIVIFAALFGTYMYGKIRHKLPH